METVDWVHQHHLRLQKVHHKALYKLKQAVAERAHFSNTQAAEHTLHVGNHVYLHYCMFGYNRIQDFWHAELYLVTLCPFDDQHVYI